jgi:trimeric autotransporter adhesin
MKARMNSRYSLRGRALLFLLLGLTAVVLSFSFGTTSCAEPVQPTLEVTPSAATLIQGQSTQLTVTRRFPGGPVDVVTERVVYSSSNRNIATVSDKGLVSAREEAGSVIIRIQDSASDAVVTVSLIVEAPRIAGIDVAPSPAIVMQPGVARQFSATARLTNGVIKDVTKQVIWSSSNEAVAIVGRTPADFGVVLAISDGDVTINATDPAAVVTGQSLVFVRGSGAQVRAVVVSPNPADIAIGGTRAFSATGLLGDGTTRDITSVVKWASSNPAIATIDLAGVATGVAAGGTTITATYAVEPSPVGDAGAPVDGGGGGDAGNSDAGQADGGLPTSPGIRGSAAASVK